MFERLLSRVHHYHLCIEGDDNPGAGTGAGDPVEKLPAADPAAPDDKLPIADPGDAGNAGDDGDPDAPDWRAKIAGDDAKELAWLNRFTSESNYHKAVRNLRAKASAGATPAALPEGATEAEIAAYRKTAGIPEKADGYGLAFPEDTKPSEGDKAALAGFAEHMHAAHMTPAAAKAAFGFYTAKMAEGREAMAEFARQSEAEAKVELTAEWGGRAEYNRTLTLGYEFLEQHLGDKAPELAGLRLADGRSLGKHPDFMRLLGAAARAVADEEALIGGDGGRGGKSIDDEYKELIDKPKLTPTEDARLMQLAEARIARDEKRGRGRAA